ncbi:MAG: hypothetical protein RL662_1898, partial [Bacteroidota bacterium]
RVESRDTSLFDTGDLQEEKHLALS